MFNCIEKLNNQISLPRKTPDYIISTLKISLTLLSIFSITAATLSSILLFKYPQRVITLLGKYGEMILSSKSLKILTIALPSSFGIFFTLSIFIIKKEKADNYTHSEIKKNSKLINFWKKLATKNQTIPDFKDLKEINNWLKTKKNVENITYLDLSNCNLKTLPGNFIKHFTNLEILDLCNNQLSFLPIELLNLKHLTTLNIAGNDFTNIPFFIFELENLNELNLMINDLDISTEDEKNLLSKIENRKIKILIDHYSTIPKDSDLKNILGNKNSLEDFWYSLIKKNFDKYNFLPTGLAYAKEISNWINNHPDTIQKITSLKFRNCALTDLPMELESFSNLEKLNFSSNNFKKIPSVIYKLKNLTKLKFIANNITSLPDDILKNLPKLKILNLNRNNLTSLPETFFSIKRKGLKIEVNDNLDLTIPKNHILYMKRLRQQISPVIDCNHYNGHDV